MGEIMSLTFLRAAFGRGLVLTGKSFLGVYKMCALMHVLRPQFRVPFARPIRFICYCLASLALSVVSAASYAEGTVAPTFSTSAPPSVKYTGYIGYFDTPEAACRNWVAYQYEELYWTGLLYDHFEPYIPGNVNMFKCYILNPSDNGVSWWSNTSAMRSCDGQGWVSYEITCKKNICPANSTGTPEANPTICTCNTNYVPSATKTSCEKNNLTITLSGGTEVEPSDDSSTSTLPIIATVKDQNTGQPPASPVQVRISLKVDPTSGGHDHGKSDRPRGGIAELDTCDTDGECWSHVTDNGAVVFNFNAPEASGTYTISATCDGCGNTATKPVDVKVDGLETVPGSSFYTFVGETDKHSDNHYLTPEAASVLWRMAVSYQMEQRFKLLNPATKKFTVTPPVLHVNDASLKWGGKFDLSGWWAGPHVEHRRGTVADVRANNQNTAIPIENFKEFRSMARSYNADAFLETPSISGRHFHLRLLNRKE